MEPPAYDFRKLAAFFGLHDYSFMKSGFRSLNTVKY